MVKKKETDGLHPASHYLVVESPAQPSTWHLRVRNMAGELYHPLMGGAWGALHEGYRGNKYAGPDKEKALEKLKALYEREGMEEPGEEDDDVMDKAAKAIATLDSEWVWAGISHNAYIDRVQDIFPLALLEKDTSRQQKAIDEGRLQDFGGLRVDHDQKREIGRANFKSIFPGTRMVLEAGVIRPMAAQSLAGRPWPMSIGYFYQEKAGEYTEFVQYERSVVIELKEVNPLTRFRVYRREAATLGALSTLSKGA